MATRTEPAQAPLPERRPELDAIRMLVVIGLVFFHSALVFAADDDFYVKNAETTETIMIIAGFGVVWAMPLLFLISGLGAWHSLQRRGAGGFARERLLRLGVPLVFATLALNPLPQWLRLRSADADYHESYLGFLPRFYDVHLEPEEFPFLVQGEHFETGHLWFPGPEGLSLPLGLGHDASLTTGLQHGLSLRTSQPSRLDQRRVTLRRLHHSQGAVRYTCATDGPPGRLRWAFVGEP
ncbi:hypothetical protein GCM10022207_89570 [Streptomyces lannensis]|uniref:Acyltransferase 3 domain-containing protein n=1 Tax=Streptomyces lannensis TaxID=766498 RepID=A0ABP7LS18_9ACTN